MKRSSHKKIIAYSLAVFIAFCGTACSFNDVSFYFKSDSEKQEYLYSRLNSGMMLLQQIKAITCRFYTMLHLRVNHITTYAILAIIYLWSVREAIIHQ